MSRGCSPHPVLPSPCSPRLFQAYVFPDLDVSTPGPSAPWSPICIWDAGGGGDYKWTSALKGAVSFSIDRRSLVPEVKWMEEDCNESQ
ncbi:unnamed protein product [Merluccius merluccius]